MTHNPAASAMGSQAAAAQNWRARLTPQIRSAVVQTYMRSARAPPADLKKYQALEEEAFVQATSLQDFHLRVKAANEKLMHLAQAQSTSAGVALTQTAGAPPAGQSVTHPFGSVHPSPAAALQQAAFSTANLPTVGGQQQVSPAEAQQYLAKKAELRQKFEGLLLEEIARTPQHQDSLKKMLVFVQTSAPKPNGMLELQKAEQRLSQYFAARLQHQHQQQQQQHVLQQQQQSQQQQQQQQQQHLLPQQQPQQVPPSAPQQTLQHQPQLKVPEALLHAQAGVQAHALSNVPPAQPAAQPPVAPAVRSVSAPVRPPAAQTASSRAAARPTPTQPLVAPTSAPPVAAASAVSLPPPPAEHPVAPADRYQALLAALDALGPAQRVALGQALASREPLEVLRRPEHEAASVSAAATPDRKRHEPEPDAFIEASRLVAPAGPAWLGGRPSRYWWD